MLYRISLGPQRIAPWIRRQAAKAVETGVDTVVLIWLFRESKVRRVNGW